MFSYYFSTIWLPPSQKPLNLLYVPPAHKPVNLSIYPHIIPVFSVLRFYCIAHFHCLSTRKQRAGFQFRIFYSCPLTHVQRTGGYSACPLWRFTQASRSIFPFFQKRILRTAELCSRKPAVIITLFTHASSIGNNPRCPGRIPFYGFESVSGNRCHNPCMGKCAISPEDYHISDFGVCIFCKSVPKIRAVHIWIVL